MNRKIFGFGILLATGSLSGQTLADYARGYMHIVGSSTVAPFARAVGKRLEKSKKIKFPRLESTGTGGGIKLFCEGIGGDYPDIANTSRPMKKKEREECQAAGVDEILELKIGYDGLVLAQSKKAPSLALTRKELRAALAKWVPDTSGKLQSNLNKTWKQINPALPDSAIEIVGPPAVSGTYDAFVDVMSEAECGGRPWVADGASEPTPDMLKKCRAVRDDGVYVEARENDEDTVFRLTGSPSKIAIFNYRLLRENNSRVRAVPIDGVEPDYDSIASHKYPGSRPLFVYVKKAYLGRIHGLKEYLAELASENAWGEKGYLKAIGLIAMPPEERATYTAEVKALGISAPTAAAKSTSAAKPSAKSKSSAKPPAKASAKRRDQQHESKSKG